MSASRHKKSFAKAILMFTYCPLFANVAPNLRYRARGGATLTSLIP